MQLKANLHFHTNDDPTERAFIDYNAFEAVDEAAAKGFEVLAFTLHNLFHFPAELVEYARQKNILLIPGIEKTIEGGHTLILNATKESEKIETFAELAAYRASNPECFIIAPHPYYYGNISHKENLNEHHQLFDAVEQSWFYNWLFNRNRKAAKVAKMYQLPFIALSDTHTLSLLENSYAIIDAKEKTAGAIFSAIRAGSFENVTRPAALREVFWQLWTVINNLGELSIAKTLFGAKKVRTSETAEPTVAPDSQ